MNLGPDRLWLNFVAALAAVDIDAVVAFVDVGLVANLPVVVVGFGETGESLGQEGVHHTAGVVLEKLLEMSQKLVCIPMVVVDDRGSTDAQLVICPVADNRALVCLAYCNSGGGCHSTSASTGTALG